MDTVHIKIIPTYIFKDELVDTDKTYTTILDNLKLKDNNDILTISLFSSIDEVKNKIGQMIENKLNGEELHRRAFYEIFISPTKFQKETNVMETSENNKKVEQIVDFHSYMDNGNNEFGQPYCFEETNLTDIYNKYKTSKSRRYELIIYVSALLSGCVLKCMIQ